MKCRNGCGACCIAPSINRPFYGMPLGKPAGVSCVHLDEGFACRLYGDSRRPLICAGFAAERSVCGDNRDQALVNIQQLERSSDPQGHAHDRK
jgi:uncharacterized protein